MSTLDIVSFLRMSIHKKFNVRVPEKIPQQIPDEFVLVRREGGGRINALLDGPGISIDCYAKTESRARELSDAISEFVCALPRSAYRDGICTVFEETRMSDYDDEHLRPRWYGSYTFKTYKPKEA